MKLVVISPEGYEPREHAVLAELFAAGLERYHVRKPAWAAHELQNFIRVVPAHWRSRLVLHQHHDMADELGCAGVHFKDSGVEPALRTGFGRHFTSRSCHDLKTLRGSLGHYRSVFLSPVFPSISKPGYVPATDLNEVADILTRRSDEQRKTAVVALGGITPANASRCAELGFDGIAVLGALWQAREPLKIFEQLQQALSAHAA